MHRFFLPVDAFQAGRVIFPPETARQIVSVLRLKLGGRVIALDNRGQESEVVLDRIEPGHVEGRIAAVRAADGEPQIVLGLYIALTQREKFEWILQKCTEVGVSEFIPLVTARSLVQDAADADRKQERWQRILQEAAEQSGRGKIPRLHEALSYTSALAHAAEHYPQRLAPWENERHLTLRQAMADLPPGSSSMALLVGPEGGFSEAEMDAARAAGFTPVTLGRRILRMETAAIVASALVLME